ncbi:MAG: hypothetical protein HYY06_05030 [Deltaproteobacteria bacterium]|nr:hypothetical protein [Deltaproteobacteria bacterium]
MKVRPLAALLLALARPAFASEPDVLGQSSEAIAQAGAVAATAVEFDATYHNPAGLAFGGAGTFSIGYLRMESWLHARGSTRSIAEPGGMIVGFAEPVPFIPAGRLRIGMGLWVHPDTLVRVVTRYPDDLYYPLFENRTQRLVVMPAAALRLWPWLSIGATVNLLAGLDGPASASEGPTRAVETTVYEEIYARASIIAGMRLQPHPRVSGALVYRQEFFVPYAIDTRNFVAGNQIDIDVEAHGLYTPHEVSVATAYEDEVWRAALEFTYERWSDYDEPYVRVESVLPAVGSLVPAPLPSPFRDTFALRLGGARTIALAGRNALKLRAGLAFAPTAVLPQSGRQNLLDSDKVTSALGAGIVLGDLGGHEVRLDTHLSWIHLIPRTYEKVISPLAAAREDPSLLGDELPSEPGIQISNPGYPRIESSGEILTFGFVMTVRR